MQPVFYDRTAAQALSDMDSDRAGLSPAEAAAQTAHAGEAAGLGLLIE